MFNRRYLYLISVFSVISDMSYMLSPHNCKYNICSGRRIGLMSWGSINNCGVNNALCRNKHTWWKWYYTLEKSVDIAFGCVFGSM